MLKRPGGQLVSFAGAASNSQLFPILSTGRDLMTKAYLGPVIITVTFVVALFTWRHPVSYNYVLACYLAWAGYYFIYCLCGKYKPWWLMLGAAMTTMLILKSPLWPAFAFVFRDLLPGRGHGLIGMLFGAGLLEELIKALPVLGAYWLGRRLKAPWRERVGVWEPLDGIILGAASAAGFTLFETMGQYVPMVTHKVAAQFGEGAGYWAGLQLLIPRIAGSLSGHMAYSGYLGYFIGLSVLKPAGRWRVLGIGYLTAAGLHALWNTIDSIFGDPGLVAVGSLSYAFLAAAILKARQISPTRLENFATQVIGPLISTPTARFSLQIGNWVVPLSIGTKVLEQNVAGAQAQSGDGLLAEVNHRPDDLTILGLRNLSRGVWTVTLPSGAIRQVNFGQSIALAVGTKINFGAVHGEIR
jgi:RsiW-degrading membrane proteinase PrsW (M82 family)